MSLYVLQENYRLIVNYRLIAREIFVKTYRLIINYRLIAREIYLKTYRLIINYRLIAQEIFLKTYRLIINYRLIIGKGFEWPSPPRKLHRERYREKGFGWPSQPRKLHWEAIPLQVPFQIPESELRRRVLWKWLQSNVKTVLIWIFNGLISFPCSSCWHEWTYQNQESTFARYRVRCTDCDEGLHPAQ